jgi:hypothetical protein
MKPIGWQMTLTLLLAFGCSKKVTVTSTDGATKDPADPSTKRSDPPEGGAMAKAKPDFTLEATALAEEFRRGKTAATTKYKGKVVEVRGILRDVARDATGEKKPYLELEGSEGASVFCYTADAEPWMHNAPGQRVTVRGKWPNFAIQATLDDCAVIDGGGDRAGEVTAAKLSQAFADDQGDSYEDKRLFVRGEVTGAEEQKQNDVIYVGLRTDDDPQVYCVFSALEKDITKTLKPGQKIRVYCRVQSRRLRVEMKTTLGIELNRCILVK